jgi:hypothetical protein
LPVEKLASAGSLASTGPETPELLFLGTSVVSGTASAVVLAIGQSTAFGDIVARLAARPDETEFDRGMRRFGMLILQTVIVLVLVILVINVALGRNALESVLFSVALAVGLTPEFLPLITIVTLALGRGADGARQGDRQAPLGDPEPRQHRRAVQRQDRHPHRRHDVAGRIARPGRPALGARLGPGSPEQRVRVGHQLLRVHGGGGRGLPGPRRDRQASCHCTPRQPRGRRTVETSADQERRPPCSRRPEQQKRSLRVVDDFGDRGGYRCLLDPALHLREEPLHSTISWTPTRKCCACSAGARKACGVPRSSRLATAGLGRHVRCNAMSSDLRRNEEDPR